MSYARKQNSELWDSVNESSLIRVFGPVGAVEQSTERDTDKDTDRDTDRDTDNDTDEEAKFQTKTTSNHITVTTSTQDWGSLNDSELISFINKISQSHAQSNTTVNDTNVIDLASERNVDVSSNPEGAKEVPTLVSSPVLLAQETVLEDIEPLDSDGMDKMEKDLEDADKYAFDDHSSYFKMKNIKQQEQGEALSKILKRGDPSRYPPIFSNCRIHVNGRTDPDILQLRKYIVLYGGTYVHFLSNKSAATHIVAESLPPRKRIQFGNCKVVTPKWIMDSIESKTLLNWADYRLEQLREHGQTLIIFNKQKDIIRERSSINQNDAIDVGVEQKDVFMESDDHLSQELQRAGVTARDPNFLPIFFSKSRLHHLSTWKSELRSGFIDKAISVLKSRNIKPNKNPKVILHVDFDCFFATVSAQMQKPPLDITKVPCCVTHGGNSADIASCNYVARKFGVRNGMWISKARSLCPELICMPYYFEEYERISQLFYQKLLSFNVDSILPVSIDEALVDISTLSKDKEVEEIILHIKEELDQITKCSVSCGAGRNVLIAKLALREAKPNGVYYQGDDDSLTEFLDKVDVMNLPGFGTQLRRKLETLIKKPHITLADLRMVEQSKLVSLFGAKMGEKLYKFSRGKDETSIDVLSEPEKYMRKTVNIDVNWGIRFETNDQVENFLQRLAAELSRRLVDIDMAGSTVSLKLAIRHPDAPVEPAKYLGMGLCTFQSRSSRLGVATRDSGKLGSELKYMWRFMNINPLDLRGVGVSMSKLVKYDPGNRSVSNQMKLDFKLKDNKTFDSVNQHIADSRLKPLVTSSKKLAMGLPDSPKRASTSPQNARPSPLPDIKAEDIDWDIFEELPHDLQDEIKGELRRRNLISSPRRKKGNQSKNDIAYLVSPKRKFPRKETNTLLISPDKISEEKQKELIFQGIPVSEETLIYEKIYLWISITIENQLPINDADLELFYDFMLKLISTDDMLRFIRILGKIEYYIQAHSYKPGYEKWAAEISKLKSILENQSFTEFEFKF